MQKTFIILSSALWGWSVSERDCCKLLDTYYTAGFRKIDTASNYPVRNDFSDYRKAENIILEWIRTNNINDLEIIVKVGSVDNSLAQKNNLTYTYLLMCHDYYLEKFNRNMNVFMVHGDDRSSIDEIKYTVRALKIVNEKLDIGLTSIVHPEIYYNISNEQILNYTILIKHTLSGSEYKKYSMFKEKNIFIAFADDLDDNNILAEKVGLLNELLDGTLDLRTWENVNFLYAIADPVCSGYVIAPKNVKALSESIDFYNTTNKVVPAALYESICNIAHDEGTE